MSGRPCIICSTSGMAKVANRFLRTRGATDVLAVLHERFPEEDISLSSVRRHRDNHLDNNQYQREEPGVGSADRARVDASSGADSGAGARHARAARATPTPSGRSTTTVVEKSPPTTHDVIAALKHGPLTLTELSDKLHVDLDAALELLRVAHSVGVNVGSRENKFCLDAAPPMGSQQKHKYELISDDKGWIEFGACGDQHLCSKYAREDCLAMYYDWLAENGIKTVLNAGNWVDGEARFNMHDLTVHGMDPQMQYLASNYPRRPGMETWAITGEDHEGWWARREGVDVGRYAERVMQDNGRTDWHNVGFMECFIPLVNASSGKSSQLCLMHPGGGSAYALSYAPQKIVEGFDGGAKPAVLLIGHYHKSSYQMTRNVHVLQTGCFQDQSLFMRQKKLAAHLGGWKVRVHVDPRTGAVDEFEMNFRNYFVRDFYDERWSEHGPVKHVPRSWSPT